ncbi:type III-B CRISPR module RAMP protein Cmr6 [uncultured Thiodictyon sp.]|jgi:CRISPR-associated protein Cmr6|uniref:type III-B CRISPR module RAMP protein Cmr6 n=1 Tax=uncultured Thiodictyon sp. TaxID=1846217 RepID=UPI0025E83631|nr:type III-B CRISPR module RAMP protein Cmr6 [uncultured Thiodictyon sp.]
MTTALMRETLRPLYTKARNAHPGLLIQRGLEVHDADNKEAKTRHLTRVCAIPTGAFYQNAYHRWKRATADAMRFNQAELALETRLFIGLSGAGMLETGCAISHSYGAPYIPGSSVKGVVKAHVRASAFGDQHPEVFAELFGADADPQGNYPNGLSGLVTFHDAWWVPGSADKPLVEEIVTTHHLEYYGQEGRVPATDFDSPIPNAQIAVQGAFLFVLEGEPAWRDLARQMLIAALADRGIGAKTRTGYGLFDPRPRVPAEPTCPWVDETIAALTIKNKAKDEETLRGKALAEEWAKLTDPVIKAAALADIRSRLQAHGWWQEPQGKSAKQAKAVYTTDTPPD